MAKQPVMKKKMGRPKMAMTKKELERRTRRKNHNPPSPFALFIRDIRRKIYPHKIGFKELNLYCKTKWSQMTSEERQYYLKMGAELRQGMRERYGSPKKRYNPEKAATRKWTAFWKFRGAILPQIKQELTVRDGRNPTMKLIREEIGRRWKEKKAVEKEAAAAVKVEDEDVLDE